MATYTVLVFSWTRCSLRFSSQYYDKFSTVAIYSEKYILKYSKTRYQRFSLILVAMSEDITNPATLG